MKSARELALEIIAKRGTPDFAICALNNAEAVARALLGKQHLTSEPAASAPVPSPEVEEIRKRRATRTFNWGEHNEICERLPPNFSVRVSKEIDAYEADIATLLALLARSQDGGRR